MNKFSKRQAYESGLVLLEELLTPGQSNGRLSEMQFNGFGALKELLLPLDNRSAWSAEDLRYETEVREFHDLLKDRFDGRYNEALSSLKNSILTSFYTPPFITEPIVESIKRNSDSIESILEP